MTRRGAAFVFAVILIILSAHRVSAEVIGPLLPRGVGEVGIRWRNIDRSFYYEFSEEQVDRNDVAIVVRYGLTANATVAGELMAAPGDLVSEDDVERFHTVGASLRTLVWRRDAFAISTGIHYVASYWRRRPNACDRAYEQLDWELLAEWSAAAGQHFIAAWGGPILSYASFIERPCEDDYWKSVDTFGATVGASVAFWNRLELDAQLVWVENPEPRFGIAYRF